jgi:Ca2+/Na+ antiporter
MRTAIKTIAIVFAAMIAFISESNAQQLSAAIVDQHSPSETSSYKLMMLGLAIAYCVYMMFSMKRKREINRLMGKAK